VTCRPRSAESLPSGGYGPAAAVLFVAWRWSLSHSLTLIY
jgi:hypothetical protein